MVDIEDENIKTLFELRPIHFIYYFEFLVFETENVMAGAKPTGYRSNSLLAYKRSTSFTCNDFDMYSNRGNHTKAKFINAFIK